MSEPPTEKAEDRFVEPSQIAPQTDQTRATLGTKMFVLFFFLLIPPLGVVLVAAVCWHLYGMLFGWHGVR